MSEAPQLDLDYRLFNPNAFHLFHYMNRPEVRFIILFGGSSSAKSYSEAQGILLQTLLDGRNTLIFRKVGASITDSIYEDFKTAAEQLDYLDYFEFKRFKIACKVNGARIDFKGLDKSEKIKGISQYKRVVLEECSEFEYIDFKQVRKRLRGQEGQQIIITFNPIKETHWIKQKIFDTEKWHGIPMKLTLFGQELPLELTEVKSIRMNETKYYLHPRTKEPIEHAPDTVIIQSTYLHNFWVVGSPDGTYGYYDEQCIADFEKDRLNDPDFYNVYALGEWGVIRTGSEFFSSFKPGTHTGEVSYDPLLALHLSVDNNVLPYITTTFWQADTTDGTHIRQIGEVCAGVPDNTVRRAAKLVAKKIKEFGADKVYLHGDASTKNTNNIDEQKRSWLDLYIDTLTEEGIEVIDCVGSRNPSVAMSGEFINAILENRFNDLSILISENCPVSVEDYLSVQKDMNGAMLKTRIKDKVSMQTYEEHGHCSDTFRYLVTDILSDQFTAFANTRKRNLYAKDGAIGYYNPDTECTYTAELLYVMPNVIGKLCFIHGKLCGGKWHIIDACLMETSSTDEIADMILSKHPSLTVFECREAYFPLVRKLRKKLNPIRVLTETNDVDKRIAATSDYVRSNILFNPIASVDKEEYASFMTSLLDYRKDGQSKEASTALSGFISYSVKSISGAKGD